MRFLKINLDIVVEKQSLAGRVLPSSSQLNTSCKEEKLKDSRFLVMLMLIEFTVRAVLGIRELTERVNLNSRFRMFEKMHSEISYPPATKNFRFFSSEDELCQSASMRPCSIIFCFEPTHEHRQFISIRMSEGRDVQLDFYL